MQSGPLLRNASRCRRCQTAAGFLALLAVASTALLPVLARLQTPAPEEDDYPSFPETGVDGPSEIKAIRDAVLDKVMSRIREGMAVPETAWISGPGWLRTFHHLPEQNASNRFYKLYSAREPLLKGIAPGDTSLTARITAADIAAGWNSRPDEWVDLNRPLETPSRDTPAPAPPAARHFYFPIADPRAKAEGFSIAANAPEGTSTGTDSPALPMPVRWIYLLKDGTQGTLENGLFVNLEPDGVKPSVDNPVIARAAWWTDDESCKINVNTASSPAYWATPVTNSREDHGFATSQPVFGEYQRWPGHPATVDLATFFHPGKRWVPPRLRAWTPAGGGVRARDYLSTEEVQALWRTAPYVRESIAGKFGSMGGEWDSLVLTSIPPPDTAEHLFATPEEYCYAAASARPAGIPGDGPRGSMLSGEGGEAVLAQIEQGGFFLTASSNSPETNAFGHPRLCLYPQSISALSFINSLIGNPNAQNARQPPPDVSPYDVSIGINTTLGGKAYYFQRSDSGSRHGEIGAYGDGQRVRNLLMYEYLKDMTGLPVPGFPEYAQSPHAFASKYSAPAGAAVESSDHYQILISMLDYARAINMNNDLLPASLQYNANGYGGTTGICACPTGDPVHAGSLGTAPVTDPHDPAGLVIKKQTQYPHGFGRACGISALVLNFSKTWEKTNQTEATPSWLQLVNQADWKKCAKGDVYQLSLLGAAFSPAQGFHALNPALGLGGLPSFNRGGYRDPLSLGNPGGPERMPLTFRGISGEVLSLCQPFPYRVDYPDSLVCAANGKIVSGLVPWAGLYGCKPLIGPADPHGDNMARLGRFLVSRMPGAAAPVITVRNFPFNHLDVYVYDNGLGQGNVVQCIKLRLPPGDYPLPSLQWPGRSKPHPGTRMAEAKANGAALFDPDMDCPLSFVVPHGDYRLVVVPVNVEADTFRPHAALGDKGPANSGAAIGGGNAGRISEWEPLAKDFAAAASMSSFSPYGLVADKAHPRSVNYRPGAALLLPDANPAAFPGVYTNAAPELIARSSSLPDPARKLMFGYNRRDTVVFRGSCDPSDTGDWDNGTGNCPDGPYINWPDDGDNRPVNGASKPYFSGLTEAHPKSTATFSPNRMATSAVMFGSLPTGVHVRVPWQTLRFRPDAGMNDSADPPPGQPFANFRSGGVLHPRDHHLLDYWWMPVVEPYSISGPFSTGGQINLNQQIFPFTYVERMTGLYAVFRGERMLAIPADDAGRYKVPMKDGKPASDLEGTEVNYRRFVNPDLMAHQFRKRFHGYYPDAGRNLPAPFNAFRSASEICELWMVPERTGDEPSDEDPEAYLRWIQGPADLTQSTRENSFWEKHKLTGDNSRERPYADVYPKLTVRSNVFRVHLVVQTLEKAPGSAPEAFDTKRAEQPDQIREEWRGSAIIERTLDPQHPDLSSIDYLNLRAKAPRLDQFYRYQVTAVQSLTE